MNSVNRMNWMGVVAGLLCLPALVSAADWTRFRGPNGTGVSADKDIPVNWTAENILWKVPIPGVGHSSPVIAKGKLFLQTASRDGNQRSLLCFEVESGKLLWNETIPGNNAKIHRLNSRASSTPATDGERVFTVFWDGEEQTMYAHDFGGKLLWKYPLGSFKSQHGAASSPIVEQGKVIFVNDQDGFSSVLCLDAGTGKEVWKKERKPFRACYSTPCIQMVGDRTELIVATTAGITSYDLQSGKEIWTYTWRFPGKELRTVASPILAAGLVLACSGDGSGDRNVIAVKTGGNGDVTRNGLVWQTTRQTFPYVPCPLVRGEHFYGVNDKGLVFCNVAKTGAVVWSERLPSPVTASPVLIDNKMFIIGEDGAVYVVGAETTYKLMATNNLGESVSASPAVASNRLFVRGQDHLFCIGKK